MIMRSVSKGSYFLLTWLMSLCCCCCCLLACLPQALNFFSFDVYSKALSGLMSDGNNSTRFIAGAMAGALTSSSRCWVCLWDSARAFEEWGSCQHMHRDEDTQPFCNRVHTLAVRTVCLSTLPLPSLLLTDACCVTPTPPHPTHPGLQASLQPSSASRLTSCAHA